MSICFNFMNEGCVAMQLIDRVVLNVTNISPLCGEEKTERLIIIINKLDIALRR